MQGARQDVKIDSSAAVAERLTALENIVVMSLRMHCSHESEFRRIKKENNEVIEFDQRATTPKRLSDAKDIWLSEIPQVTEDVPFPQHPDWVWKNAAFHEMATAMQTHVAADPPSQDATENEQATRAIKVLTSKSTMKTALLRFYRSTEEKEGGDRSKERRIIRFDKTPVGQKACAAFHSLDPMGVIANPLAAQVHADRAPKQGLMRSFEAIIEAFEGGKGGGRRSR